MSSKPNVSLNDVTDVELAGRAAAGDEGAFQELYRRNVASAWRIAQAVTASREDASDAVGSAFVRVLQALARGRLGSPEHFRPYLLSTTRRAAVDLLRKAGRVRAGGDDADDPGLDMAGSESAPVMAKAFRSLPERWRTAAWLAVVEDMDAPAAAAILAVSPSSAEQLTARATTALRERYVELSLRTEVDQVCRFTTERLGTYVSAGVSGREADRLDKHLAKCPACAVRLEDLKDLDASLRETMVAIPLSLAALTTSRWHHVFGSLKPVKRGAGMAPFGSATRPIAVGAAALAALGVIGATIWGQPRHPSPTSPRVALAAPALATPATIVETPNAGAAGSGVGSLSTANFALTSSISPATTTLASGAPAFGPAVAASTPTTTSGVTLPATSPTTPAGPPPVPGTVPVPTTVPLPVTVPTLPPVTLPTVPLTVPTLPKVTLPSLPIPTTLPPLP